MGNNTESPQRFKDNDKNYNTAFKAMNVNSINSTIVGGRSDVGSVEDLNFQNTPAVNPKPTFADTVPRNSRNLNQEKTSEIS